MDGLNMALSIKTDHQRQGVKSLLHYRVEEKYASAPKSKIFLRAF